MYHNGLYEAEQESGSGGRGRTLLWSGGAEGLPVRIKKEGCQGRCCTNRKLGMARGQGFSMGMLAMSGAVQAAKLCKVVSDGAEVLQETFHDITATGGILDALRNKLQFFEGCFCEFGNVRFARECFATLGKNGFAAGLDKLFCRPDGEGRIRLHRLFHASDLFCEVSGIKGGGCLFQVIEVYFA